MAIGTPVQIKLDYAAAATAPLLKNISGAAMAGDLLWTVSDEGRTVECLRPDGDGYILDVQLSLDALFPELPEGEADLEAVSVDGDHIWVCGSHCRVRAKPVATGEVNPKTRRRPSRHLLGRLSLHDGRLAHDPAPVSLPFTGGGSLRRHLSSDPHLALFLDLPSKEGGLDIEGLAVRGRQVLLGLRGPVLDGQAVVVELRVKEGLAIAESRTFVHIIDLGGLGIRDAVFADDHVLLLAGPTGAADGPFRIHKWQPAQTKLIQATTVIHEWVANGEHPEGLCPLHRSGGAGLLVVYDTPAGFRVTGTTYLADWFPLL